MHSVVWILITIFCSSCVGVSVWLLSRKSHNVDFKALGLKQNKAFLEQLDHERVELKKSKEQKKVLEAKLAQSDPEKIKNAPVTMPISRPDEAKAARELKLKCF